MATDADDAVATMRLIDDCYLAAGMLPRGRMQLTSSWLGASDHGWTPST
jgi:hypothetical protein